MYEIINEILLEFGLYNTLAGFIIKLIILIIGIVLVFCFVNIAVQLTKANIERKKQIELLERIEKRLIKIDLDIKNDDSNK